MASQVSPPREEDFNDELEEGEDKMDMSLDEIIKLNRDTIKESPVRSNSTQSYRNDRPPPPLRDARDAIRRSAASRSAAIRQGRIPERRSGMSRPYAPPLNPRSSQRNEMFKRSGLPRRHLAPGDKVDIYEGSAGRLKISVINENSKPASPPTRAPPPPPPSNRGRMSWGRESDYKYRDEYREEMDVGFEYDDRPPMQFKMRFSSKMDDCENVPTRHRTLDSLFASIKEQREFGRTPQSFGSGRFRAQSFRKRG